MTIGVDRLHAAMMWERTAALATVELKVLGKFVLIFKLKIILI